MQTFPLDWEKVIQAASTEKLLPTLYGQILQLDLASEFPTDVLQFLAEVRHLSFERNERILTEVAQIAKLLNNIGIEPVLLKGAAYLVSSIYRDIGARFLFDVDILVPRNAIGAAAEVLQKQHYIADDSKPDAVHHFRPLRRQAGVEVEIHHSLGGKLCDAILSGGDIFRDSTVVEFRGTRVRVPAPEHLIIHHVLHSQIHHRYSDRIWPLLRDLYDLLLLQQHFSSAINWGAIERKFRQNKSDSVLALYLLLWEDVFGTQKPIRPRLTRITRLQWGHRKLLRRYPFLRLADPFYILFLSFLPRARHAAKLLRSRNHGWKYLAKLPFQTSFYRNLFRSFVDEINDA